MRSRLAIGVLAGALVLLACTEASGQAWVPEARAGYSKLWVRWMPGAGYHPGPEAADGALFTAPVPYGEYHELFFGFYGEVGLFGGFALFAQAQALRLFFLEDPRSGETGVHASPGEPAFGLRGRILRRGRFALAGEGFVRLPTVGNEPVQPVIGTEAGNPVIAQLRIGTGVFEGGFGLHAGLGGDRTWGAAGLSITFVSGGRHSLLDWYVKLGRDLGKGFELRLRVAGHHPLGDGEAPWGDSPSGIGNGTRYLGLTLELEKALGRGFGLGVSFAGGFMTSVRQTSGPVFTVFATQTW